MAQRTFLEHLLNTYAPEWRAYQYDLKDAWAGKRGVTTQLEYSDFMKLFPNADEDQWNRFDVIQQALDPTKNYGGEEARNAFEGSYLGTMIAPKRDQYGRLMLIEAMTSNGHNCRIFWAGWKQSNSLGSGGVESSPESDTDGNKWYRTHTPGGVVVHRQGLGFALYTGLALTSAFNLGGRGAYSIPGTRREPAELWWNEQESRGYAVTDFGFGGEEEEYEVVRHFDRFIPLGVANLKKLWDNRGRYIELEEPFPKTRKTRNRGTTFEEEVYENDFDPGMSRYDVSEGDLLDDSDPDGETTNCDGRINLRADVMRNEQYGSETLMCTADGRVLDALGEEVGTLSVQAGRYTGFSTRRSNEVDPSQQSFPGFGALGEPLSIKVSVRYTGDLTCRSDYGNPDGAQFLDIEGAVSDSDLILFRVMPRNIKRNFTGVARYFLSGHRPSYLFDVDYGDNAIENYQYVERFDAQGNANWTEQQAEYAARAQHGPSPLLSFILLDSIARVDEDLAVTYASRPDVAELLAKDEQAQAVLKRLYARGQESLFGLSSAAMRHIQGVHRAVRLGQDVRGPADNPFNLKKLSKKAEAGLKKYGVE